ncbi:ERBB receptor feedback inhibitor 1 [Centroberyx gerrardi]
MARSQTNLWGQHDMNRLCFGLSTDLTELQQQQVAKEFDSNFPLSQSPFYSDTYRPTSHNMLRPHEGDQVVPSFQRLTVFEGQHREAKPLPPLPDAEELMSVEAADSEVEFFTSDRCRLLPKSCPKALSRGRGCGRVNQAYQENGGGNGSMAFSWPGTEHSGTNTGFALGGARYGTQREDSEQLVAAVRDTCRKQPDQVFRYSYSGPAYPALHRPTDKPEIPPRVPIPPKPLALPKTAVDEWSVSSPEDGKPPKIPPRVPLVPVCPPRTPSPKSLPLYINGVMPVTQSFAPNPKYVSKALQRQQSERAPPADQTSPCIVPVMKDGRQASATHYFLLPCRPAYMDRLERLFREPDRKDSAGMCSPELGCQNR